MIRKISSIYDLLEHLEKRRAMYLGNNYTFQSLDAFITGYTIASNENQLETEQYNNFYDFNPWILGHLPEHFGQSGGWHWQISNRNPNNDEKSFNEFFEFLEIFKTASKKIEKVKIEKFEFETTEYHSDSEKYIQKKEIIDSIHKIRMEYSKTIWIQGFNQNKMVYKNWAISENEYETRIMELIKN